MDKDARIKELEDELKTVVDELEKTKIHLKQYTAPASNKVYYEKHKEMIKKRAKEYREKNPCKITYTPTPEQKQIYNRREYLKRKEKLRLEKVEKVEENQL